jgi:hypothetical protein
VFLSQLLPMLHAQQVSLAFVAVPVLVIIPTFLFSILFNLTIQSRINFKKKYVYFSLICLAASVLRRAQVGV